MTCARVGYGVIAGIHARKFAELGLGTAAVVEIDPVRRERAAADGHLVFSTYAEAAAVRPAFWDVCVDTSAHLAVLKDIIAVDPWANILIEKPICHHRDIRELRALLGGFRGRLTVNENYSSSTITSTVRRMAFDVLGLRARRVVVEMTKNRVRDFEAGRFVDYEAGALGYEGTHMLAILDDLGAEWAPYSIDDVEWDDALIELQSGPLRLSGQGMADVTCSTRAGVPLGLFTSMTGTIKYPYPPYMVNGMAPADVSARYRIVAVDGEDGDNRRWSVVGFFEPVRGLPRGQGVVAVLRDGEVADLIGPLPDDTMKAHLGRAVRYFGGHGANPCSVDDGVRAVEWLHAMVQHGSEVRVAA